MKEHVIDKERQRLTADFKPQELTVQEVLSTLGVDKSHGLTQKTASVRLDRYGPNQLKEGEKESLLAKIMEQFEDPMVRLLLIAAIISLVISYLSQEHGGSADGDLPIWIEPFVIVLILVANGMIGIYQDYNAEKSVEMLRRLQSKKCTTLRGGEWHEIASEVLVPGDIIKLTTGEKVPADCRLIQVTSNDLKIDQSILTGESMTVSKTVEKQVNVTELALMNNMLFSGTTIAFGSCVCAVAKTGELTELGHIKQEVDEATQEKKDDASPLKKQLNEFGDFLAKAIGIICIGIWLMSVPRFFDKVHQGWLLGSLYYFKQAVALGVAAIPEGLPAVITTCLALGTRRMIKRKALVRKLTKVETLGCTTVICSDKTGTLTRNEMFANRFSVIGSHANLEYNTVHGVGYSPEGEIDFNENLRLKEKNTSMLALNCLLNQETRIIKRGNEYVCLGLPTEGALVAFGNKLAKRTGARLDDWERIFTLSFSSFRKMMSVLVKNKSDDSTKLFTKGGAEFLLKKCSYYLDNNNVVNEMDQNVRSTIEKDISKLSHMGLRVLALSYKEGENLGKAAHFKSSEDVLSEGYNYLLNPNNHDEIEGDSVFLGLVCIADPVKEEVKDAIDVARTAGIVVFMITGDNPETALAISKELTLVDQDTPYFQESQKLQDSNRLLYLGRELDQLDEKAKMSILANAIKHKQSLIFARTTPKHKRELVKLILQLEEIVAMTGDGVNDAPALKQASIGIAMGIHGTDVAKEASDLILLDDNFATIVKAIEEGRAIYANMKAFIRYMISSNIGEVVSIFITSLLGIPEGFNSIQLLWVNLVTDGLPATALSFNPPEPDIMRRSPRKKDDRIVDSWIFMRYIVIGIYVGVATTGIFIYYYTKYDWSNDAHTLITLSELRNWTKCVDWTSASFLGYESNPCDYFMAGKRKASTLSLTVLVIIEMLNSLNAMSENQGLFQIGFFKNIWLWQAVILSSVLHCFILYIPGLSRLFGTVPLGFNDWLLVLIFTVPVIFIEEVLKYFSRRRFEELKKLK